MSRDLRDPELLGEVLLETHEERTCDLSATADAHSFTLRQIPNYRDETTIEKYGRPQSLPSTLPN